MDQKHVGLKTKLNTLVAAAKEKHNVVPMFTHFKEFKPWGEVIRATSCILFDKNMKSLPGGVKAKGLSLVSTLDNGSKVEGKATAIHRALKALENRKNYFPIKREEAVENLEINKIIPEGLVDEIVENTEPVVFKGTYFTKETPVEELLHNIEKSRLERKIEKNKK